MGSVTNWDIRKIKDKMLPKGINLLTTTYKNNNTLMDWECNTCGHTWEKKLNKMIKSTFCPKCLDRHSLSMDEINYRVASRPFLCISEGTHKRATDIEWQCINKECKHTWFRSFSATIAWGGDCSECRQGKRYTVRNIQEKLLKDNRSITLLTDLPEEDFLISTLTITWKCLIDGHEWLATVGSVMSGGSGCGECSGNIKLTKEEAQQKVYNKGLDFVLISEEYFNSHTPTTWECSSCKHTFPRSLSHLITNAKHCPNCGDGNYVTTNLTNADRNKETWLFEPAIVYKLRCWNDTEEFNKIGHTIRTVQLRFAGKSNMPYNYEILEEIHTNRYDGVYLEEKLKEQHKVFKYIPKIKFGGYKECFTKLIE